MVNSGIVKMLITTLTLILLVASCDAQERSDYESRVAEEEALAANDVWHAAKLRGVAFRAVGQGRTHLVLPLIQRRHAIAWVDQSVEE